MNFQPTLPACCSVGFMYNFDSYIGIPTNVPHVYSTSQHFIAIFKHTQKKAYDKVCKEHKLLSVTAVRGGHDGEKKVLAICVFKKGTKS